MDAPVLDLTQVRKVYKGKIEALRGIALQVPKGTVFGLLGPNGAGKSTLVKILTTIIRPTSCRGTMLGQPIGHKPTLAKLGYLPEHARFPSYLTGRQVVEYSAGMAGLSVKRISSRVDQALEQVKMKDWSERKIKTYSKGMKQRIGIAQALINEPELLFLDEPTDGVDPEGRLEIRDLINRLRDEGRTIFINTHLLGELEQVADRVAILNHGELLREGALAELTKAGQEFEIVVSEPLNEEVQQAISSDEVLVEGPCLTCSGTDARDIQSVIDYLRSKKVIIESIQPKRVSLEQFFLEVVEQSRANLNA